MNRLHLTKACMCFEIWTAQWLLQYDGSSCDVLALLSVIHMQYSFRGQPSAQTSANNELLYTCRIVHLATDRVTKKASAFKVLHHYTEPQAGILCFSRVHLVMARHGKIRKRQQNVSNMKRMQHSTVHLPTSTFQACRPRSQQSGVTNALAHVCCSRQSMNLVHVSVAFALVVVNHRSL